MVGQARARKKKEKEQKKLAEKLAIEDGAVCGVESWILTHFDHDHDAFLIELCGR